MITISAVILAGGLSRRMRGADKGLQRFQNKPLVTHVLARLHPQLSDIAINANRHSDQYARFGVPVFADETEGFQGPLSGMLTALHRAVTDFVLFVPCDCPFLPLNLLEKLKSAGHENLSNTGGSGINEPSPRVTDKKQHFSAYAYDGEREHPTFCLMSRSMAEPLEKYLASGERRLLGFMRAQGAIAVDFSEQPEAFRNFNTPEDLQNDPKTTL